MGAAGLRLPFMWQARTQSLQEDLVDAWVPLGRGCLLWQAWYAEPAGGLGARAGAVHRACTRSWWTRGRSWAAVAFRAAGAVHRAFRRTRRTRRRRWTAVAFRVAGAVQSLQEELRDAWAPPLGRGCLSCGRRSNTEPFVGFWSQVRHFQ